VVCIAVFACDEPRSSEPDPTAGPPNILLILVDDLGWRDPSFMGSDFFETPRIDRLAAEGLVFRNAYSCSGNCAPSRACLMSGQYSPRHRVYAVADTARGSRSSMRVLPRPNRRQLDGVVHTMAESLRDAGYDTGFFGKWHLGSRDGNGPGEQGFDTVHDVTAAKDRRSKDDGDPKSMREITNAAIEFVRRPHPRPFFAFVSHHATHQPFEASPEWVARFENAPPGRIHRDAGFASMLGELDHHVGRLLDEIDRPDSARPTLVVFVSDNGGLAGNPQTPLRGSKGMYYEGGIRVPMIVRWPGVTAPGSTTHVTTSNVDFHRTFLDVAGVEPGEGLVLDGASLVETFSGGERLEPRSLYWHFPGYLNNPRPGSRDRVFRTRPVSVIRRGEYKLLLHHEEWALDGGREQVDSNRAVELYDLDADPGETRDLSGAETGVRDALLDDLLAWIERADAYMAASPNEAYRP